MKKSKLAVGCAAVCAAAAGTAWGEPSRLGLEDLDRITAGSDYNSASNPAPNGGAIVGNGSSATLVSTGEVTLGDGAQSDARALNMVNSSESAVANGVNVFDGRVDESAEIAGAQFDVTQANTVAQDQRRLSSLPGYQRGANTQSTFDSSGTSDSSSSSNLYDQVMDLDKTTTLDTKKTDGSVTSDGAPTFKLTGSLGKDLANLDVEFNYPGGGGGDTIGAVFNGGYNFDISAGDIDIDTDQIDVVITLPSLSLAIDAMGCFVLNGDCTIDGERTESSEVIDDNSTLYTFDQSDSSSETWQRSGSESVQAPFELRDAQAEYIVVDESEIDVTASYLVQLSGGAQSSLQAMNAVNAAGSAVANGVNVSRMGAGNITADTPSYNLVQSNVINHSR
jgi:hypothetical protein